MFAKSRKNANMEYCTCISVAAITNMSNLQDNEFFPKFVPKYFFNETNQDC